VIKIWTEHARLHPGPARPSLAVVQNDMRMNVSNEY
jgi:hypothetical protein